MAWDKKCNTRYNNRPDIFEAFKARREIKSCWDSGGETSLVHLKDVLTTGKDRSRQDSHYIRKHSREDDEYLSVDICDHCAYFKTADNRVIFTSQPYGDLDAIAARVKGWEEKHGLKVEFFGPGHGWHHPDANLVVITLTDAALKRDVFGIPDDAEISGLLETNAAYIALFDASRQLEICGWCPKARHNNLHPYFDTCALAVKDGVWGCHKCIAAHFIKKAQD